MAAPRRNRRARRAGNPAELMPPLWPIVARDTNRVPDGRSEADAFGERFPNWVQCMPYGQIVTAHGQDRPGASRPTCRHPASGLCSCGAVEYQWRPCRSAVTNPSRRTKLIEWAGLELLRGQTRRISLSPRGRWSSFRGRQPSIASPMG
jgi:hypothetical protein